MKNSDGKIILHYDVESEQNVIITIEDKKLITQIAGHEISGECHHRLTITVIAEAISGQ